MVQRPNGTGFLAKVVLVLVLVHHCYAASALEVDECLELKRSVRDSELPIFVEAVAVAPMTLGRGEIPRGKHLEEHMWSTPSAGAIRLAQFPNVQCHRHV